MRRFAGSRHLGHSVARGPLPLLLALLAASATIPPRTLPAQGQILPRLCPPPPCTDRRCGDALWIGCPGPTPIVRTASHVRAELAGRVLRYEIDETFVNRGGGLGEADYLFPLPAGAAFEDLKLSINGELVSGETMNATDARRVYEEIVRKRRDPALVEWMGSGLLRARIFPIQPGEEKRVVVRFQTVAPREGSALRVDYVRGTPPAAPVIPMAVRENVDRDGVRLAPDRADREPENTFTLAYAVNAAFGTPYSPTHALRVNDRGGRRTVTASGAGREVTILLPLLDANAAAITVLGHRDGDDDGFALITITPPATRQPATPRDLTFVVDVSGSMAGRKLQQARAAGEALLASLGAQDRFRIIDFSTDVRGFRDDFVAATPSNLREARRYLDALSAEGSTNISAALDAALDVPNADGRLPLVVFITDGEPTVGERNPDAIAALAARRRGDARLFTVGVSADVNATLIEQLALEGHGTAHFVRADESVERTISLLASRLTRPLLTDVRITADGVRLRQLHPVLPVDLFAGQDLVLLARYDGDGPAHLRVEGRTAGGRVHWETTADFPRRERANAFVPRLWAAQRLGWLAAEKRRNGGTTELDQEIRDLGERYGIPTEFSSYLVVEPDAPPLIRGRADASAPAPAAAAVASEKRFEAARAAAAQRAATSLVAVDSVSTMNRPESAGIRRIGARQFMLRDSTWTDVRYTASMRTVQVKAFSPLYFELAARLGGLSETLVLGDRLLIAGRAVALRIGSTGLETMDERALAALVQQW